MKTVKQLREERGLIKAELDALYNTLTVEKRNMTAEEGTKFDETTAKIDALDVEIRRAEKMEELARVAGAPKSDSEEKEVRQFSFSKLITEVGNNKLTGLEKEMVEESQAEARSLGITPSGIYLSNKVMDIKMNESRTMSAGSATAGGNFIPLEKVGFFDALYAKTVLDSLGATKLTGLSANVDLTGFSSGVSVAWAAETADAASGDQIGRAHV